MPVPILNQVNLIAADVAATRRLLPPSRDSVDDTYSELMAAGHRGQQLPHDAFWGARYAVVEDPAGNSVGLMSPIDDQAKVWPPVAPPAGAT